MQLKGYGVLQVEPTDHCNLQCLMCRPHRDSWSEIHGIPKGFLSVDSWQAIANGFVADDVIFDHIIFQWLGDPLLHPQIERLISIAQNTLVKQVQYLRMDSNMILLDEKRCQRIIDSSSEGGLPLLLVASIDAHSPQVYTKVKGRDALSVVRRNLRRLLRLRHQSGQNCPINIQLQFVVQEGNAHEALAFKNYWLDLLRCQGGEHWHDEIMFKRLSVDGGAEGQASADTLYEQSIQGRGIRAETIDGVEIAIWENRPWQQDDEHRSNRSACPGLWSTPVLRHDGSLMMCCADLQGELSLGNLSEHRFVDLWNSAQAQQYRRDHLQGEFKGVCADCGGINWYSLPQGASEIHRL